MWHQVNYCGNIAGEHETFKRQSPEDAKLRTALENMRYKACTQEDITFLCFQRIAGKGPNDPKSLRKSDLEMFQSSQLPSNRPKRQDKSDSVVNNFARRKWTGTSFLLLSIDRWEADPDELKNCGRETSRLA